jgi:peptide subunit release factor 1 (eRF1)
MSQIPLTTRPSPDQARLREVMRRVAEVESANAPVLSVYLDLAPAGDEPSMRPANVVLRRRLSDVEATYPAHSSARQSLDEDRTRLEALLKDDEVVSQPGVAVFACHAAGLWEVVTSAAPFETRISSGPTADLFGLAELLEDSEAWVVALADTSGCRLFVTRRGSLVERATLDEEPDEHKRHQQGGWSQARYQRHIDMQDRRFAREAADAIAKLVEQERARHLLLAGEERSLSVLEPELPESVAAMVEHVEHVHFDSPVEEVAAEVAPILAAIREAEETDAADRVVAGVRAGDLGVAGIDTVSRALEWGQVDELVLDDSIEIDEELKRELVRQAALTGAQVVTIDGHAGLAALGGVGATLRFKVEEYDPAQAQP